MTFPIYIHVFGLRLHPHPVFEMIAYAAGLGLHSWMKVRRRALGTVVAVERNLWVIVGAVFGGLIGGKVLAWAESFGAYVRESQSVGLEAWLGGKTIVGGLIGGWIGVEIAKRLLAINRSTGDEWVFPLLVSMAIGRVGCFLTGLSDNTYGDFTRLPWGVDFGDGVRHPTQLYDIVFLILLAGPLWVLYARPHVEGAVFRWFMMGYCGYRFLVEFIKPTGKPIGVSAIQVACVGVVIYCAYSLTTKERRPQEFKGS